MIWKNFPQLQTKPSWSFPQVAPLLDAWLLAVDMAEAGQIINDPHSIAAKLGNPGNFQGFHRVVGDFFWDLARFQVPKNWGILTPYIELDGW